MHYCRIFSFPLRGDATGAACLNSKVKNAILIAHHSYCTRIIFLRRALGFRHAWYAMCLPVLFCVL